MASMLRFQLVSHQPLRNRRWIGVWVIITLMLQPLACVRHCALMAAHYHADAQGLALRFYCEPRTHAPQTGAASIPESSSAAETQRDQRPLDGEHLDVPLISSRLATPHRAHTSPALDVGEWGVPARKPLLPPPRSIRSFH